MDEKQLKIINDIIEDYINYLYINSPIFLNNIAFFYSLHRYDENFVLQKMECEFVKMNGFDTFNLVKEFFETYHNEELEKVEKLFNDGVFNIYYFDELKEEDKYVKKSEHKFQQSVRDGHASINLLLDGNTHDFPKTVHEIRHQLNQPNGRRSVSNDMLTESLSLFDEMIALDFFYEKIGKDAYIIKNNRLVSIFKRFNFIYFISKLVNLKEKLGYIDLENYEILYGNNGKKGFIKNCEIFLNKINSYEQLNADKLVLYTFGIFIAMFMYKKYKEDNNYLDKVKKLNECVRNNTDIKDCLKVVDINILDKNIINDMRNNLIEEINLLKEKLNNVNKI